MRRSLAAAMVILFLIFFLPWLWGEHSPEEEAAPPEDPPVMDEDGEDRKSTRLNSSHP